MKYLSTFSGVGGLDLGLPAEWKCVGFSEVDKYANMVLKYNFPNIKNYGDITKIQTDTLPNFDLLTGGSPCQDLSIAGKRRGLAGERSGLFMEYIRILRAKKPKYFIWENVKGALSSNQGFDFAQVLFEMAESGYNIWWQVLNAKDFGVPQHRERIFIIGVREESPKEVLFKSRKNKTSAKQEIMKVADFRNDEGLRIRKEFISNTLQAQARQDGTAGQPLIIIPVLTPDRLEKRQNGRRFKNNGEERFTLTAQDKHGIFNGQAIRRLTPIECERLMSWPDNWTKYGIDDKGNKIEISDTQRYKMCGNGVVSKIIKILVKNLL